MIGAEVLATALNRFRTHPTQTWLTLAVKTREAFNRRFWNDRDGCCHDVIADPPRLPRTVTNGMSIP